MEVRRASLLFPTWCVRREEEDAALSMPGNVGMWKRRKEGKGGIESVRTGVSEFSQFFRGLFLLIAHRYSNHYAYNRPRRDREEKEAN